MSDHTFELIVGAYAFAAGSYLFGYKILLMLFDIRRKVTNHIRHEIDDLSDRISRLEDKE